MAPYKLSSSLSMTRVLLSLIILSSLQLMLVSSFEFQVGDRAGWVVPPSNDTKVYNDWASEKRFRVGDTIRFKYGKDSVMEVSEADYKRCNSTRPNFFSNTGNTIFSLDHSGYFYFISGAFGHCNKGQRMIVKVMGQESSSTSSAASVSEKSVAILPVATIHLLYLAHSRLFNLLAF